jgi:hypothetical protein
MYESVGAHRSSASNDMEICRYICGGRSTYVLLALKFMPNWPKPPRTVLSSHEFSEIPVHPSARRPVENTLNGSYRYPKGQLEGEGVTDGVNEREADEEPDILAEADIVADVLSDPEADHDALPDPDSERVAEHEAENVLEAEAENDREEESVVEEVPDTDADAVREALAEIDALSELETESDAERDRVGDSDTDMENDGDSEAVGDSVIPNSSAQRASIISTATSSIPMDAATVTCCIAETTETFTLGDEWGIAICINRRVSSPDPGMPNKSGRPQIGINGETSEPEVLS